MKLLRPSEKQLHKYSCTVGDLVVILLRSSLRSSLATVVESNEASALGDKEAGGNRLPSSTKDNKTQGVAKD